MRLAYVDKADAAKHHHAHPPQGRILMKSADLKSRKQHQSACVASPEETLRLRYPALNTSAPCNRCLGVEFRPDTEDAQSLFMLCAGSASRGAARAVGAAAAAA